MIGTPNTQIDRRLYSLEKHLKMENPVLLRVVQSFRDLDWVAYRMGLLERTESYAARVPWWPMISLLGTFSAGKSTFINSFLDQKVQRTGSQAVDDKFTVICYSKEDEVQVLPGLALDADPRFPFYQMSEAIEKVVRGEGRRIDTYLQLKTCPSPQLRGKILIDSPGFDADDQRTAVLRITDHIIDLSDLVLVLFDARHPEPGAMRDTLEHLVASTLHRHDFNKFLFILNQIDCTARENNLEDVVGAWQRSMAQSGLTAGRFYQIYDDHAASPIEDETTRNRYRARRSEDLDDIKLRIQRVDVERSYRIIGVLEHTAHLIQDTLVPKLGEALQIWRQWVLIGDGLLLALLVIGWLTISLSPTLGWPWPVISGLHLTQGTEAVRASITLGHLWSWAVGLGGLAGITFLHHRIRRFASQIVGRRLERQIQEPELQEAFRRGFRANTHRWWRPFFLATPLGWGRRSKARIAKVMKEIDVYVQSLNDRYTNPSGKSGNTN